MRMGRLLWKVLFACGLVGLLAVPAHAELFFEGQIWGEEFEDGAAEMAQLQLFQTINDERFEAYDEVIQVFQLELVSVPVIQDGLVKIRARVFKADGSRINLPAISASVQESSVLVQRSTAATLELGDVIRWRVRFKGVPTVSQNGACQIIVGVANRELNQ